MKCRHITYSVLFKWVTAIFKEIKIYRRFLPTHTVLVSEVHINKKAIPKSIIEMTLYGRTECVQNNIKFFITFCVNNLLYYNYNTI